MRLFQKQIPGALALAASLLVSGCFESGRTSGPDPVDPGDQVTLNIRMGVGSVSALGKSSIITLNKLVVVISSNANDTIRDTITASTSPALNPVSTTGQNISKSYTLKALRTWKILAISRDTRDSVIHRDSATVPALYAGYTASVNLNLASRYSMYEARFLSLPDSIESSTPAMPKQKLNINRLVLKVDGVIVRDSTATPGPYFAPSTIHTLAYDYVSIGTSAASVSSGTSQDLYAVQFPTVDTGYIVGDNITLKSVNGGATWSSQATGGTSKTLRALSFLNGRKGVIAGGSDSLVIRRTTDGGTTWTRTLGTLSANTLRAIHLVNDTGWAIRSHVSSLTGAYQYYRTLDGGASWTPTVTQEQAYSLRGVNGTTAWAVGPAGKIRKTGGDGMFSSVQTSGTTRTLRSVYPVNANLVYVVGDTGLVLRTTDGGANWVSKTSGTTRNLNSVWFLDAATGFAVGDSGKVISTSDSGNTWANVTSPTTANLNAINFFGGKGYVVGAGGAFFIITGPRYIEMMVFGPMGTWNVANPLYSGSKYINGVAGANDTIPLVLQWVGPSTGTGSLSATLGMVGKVTLNGTVPTITLPKAQAPRRNLLNL
jgi:photosystem II stability/assembly factor-like uncharacterized protein